LCHYATAQHDHDGRAGQGQSAKRDLLRRNLSAAAPNQKRCGGITEFPTDEGKLHLA
jgi:hypothetical protein